MARYPNNSDRERATHDLLLSRPGPAERPARLDQVRAQLFPDGYRPGLFPHSDRRDNPRFWVENRTRTLSDALDELNELGKTLEARRIIEARLSEARANLPPGQTLTAEQDLLLRFQEFSDGETYINEAGEVVRSEKTRIEEAGLALRAEHLVRANHYIRQALDWVPDYLDGHQLRERYDQRPVCQRGQGSDGRCHPGHRPGKRTVKHMGIHQPRRQPSRRPCVR